MAEQAGRPTARATASRAASCLPFGAVAPLLRDSGYGSAVVGDDDDLLRRFATALAPPAGGRLVLLVDDAHLLDDASASLIHHLAVAGSTLLVLTVRAREPVPDLVAALWKDSILQRLELAELDGEDVEQLLRNALGRPVDRAAVVRLAASCQGNVLFLRELVLGALEAGVLVCDDGLWRLAGPLAPSPRLVELVQSRLAGLDAVERALLEVLASAESLGPAELAIQADFSVAAGLERKGLLVSSLAGRRLELRLAHPVHGEVLRSQASTLRTRAVARELAGVVEAMGARRSGDPFRLAGWLLDAGEARPDVMLAAARTARDRHDLVLAERLARAAAGAGAGFQAALLAAQVTGLAGRGEQAETELAPLASEASGDAETGQVAVARVDNFRHMGRSDEAMALADRAAWAISDPGWRAEIDARRCGLLLEVEGPQAAAEAAEELRRRAGGEALVWACLISTIALVRTGRLGAAAEAVAQAHEVAGTLAGGSSPWLCHATVAEAETLRQAGELEDAAAMASALYDGALVDGSVETQAHAALQMATAALDRGRIVTAARHAREAAVLFRQLNRIPARRNALVVLATADALRREPGGAALAELESLGVASGLRTAADLLVARAWTAVAARDLPAARGHLEDAVVISERIGDRVGQMIALHDLVRLGHAKVASTRLGQLAEEVEGDMAATRAAHADAAGRGDPTALEEASVAFEALGALLLAAEAAADAAVAWRRALRPGFAVRAERRAVAIVERCEGAVTPALDAVEGRALLTAAERETALLAAAGRSNKEIAAQLVLSYRTVENHLHRAYEKLGVSGRSELASALEG